MHTKGGARCDIDVYYSSGPSTAAGLQNKTANSAGNVSWTWQIGGNTTLGQHRVTVRCSKNGVSHSKTKYFRVT